MAKFFYSYNNGVYAVIREDHAKLYGTVKDAGGDPIKAGARVFAFCSERRMKDEGLSARMTFTGTEDDLVRLVQHGGHELSLPRLDSGWDGYVPFSNGIQYGFPLGGYPVAEEEKNNCRAAHELRYITTLADVMDVFGIA